MNFIPVSEAIDGTEFEIINVVNNSAVKKKCRQQIANNKASLEWLFTVALIILDIEQ